MSGRAALHMRGDCTSYVHANIYPSVCWAHVQTQSQSLLDNASQVAAGAGFMQFGGPSQLHLGGLTQDTLGGASQGLGMGLGFLSEAAPQYGGPLLQAFTQEVCACVLRACLLPVWTLHRTPEPTCS